ncbi:LuxR C-terminal-related transcriptional regulator [Xanthobacter sp. TB0136]|uniref:LuxR C-terminal-related transcriptional regulator n=1 Tax=Xanthobacter sp. TB0136 TaxID=3459177 RepID=UPI004039B13E
MAEDAKDGHRLIIADDHPLFRGALREAVLGHDATTTIEDVGTFDDLTRRLEEDSDFDLVLLDLTMPGARGFSGLVYLRAQYAALPVLVVSGNEDPMVIRRCLELGASGFMPKTMDTSCMRKAIARVLAGDTFTPPDIELNMQADAESEDIIARLGTLTPQQVRVLMMLTEGRLNKQIAYELSVSEATVKAHVSAILQKLGVESRTQAVIAVSKVDTTLWSQQPA